jgi:hypothetical protein
VLAVAQHLHAIHEHLFDTAADLVRLFWRRQFNDGFVVEYDDKRGIMKTETCT